MGDAAWAALISGTFAILALLVAAVLNRRTGSKVDTLADVVDYWKGIAKDAQAEAADSKRRLADVERQLERCEARGLQLEAEVGSLAETLQAVLDRLA